MKMARRTIWAVVLVALAITWLPYFGILNASTFIGPFPMPLAVTLACNVALTVCVVLLYLVYFRPFIRTIAREKRADTQ